MGAMSGPYWTGCYGVDDHGGKTQNIDLFIHHSVCFIASEVLPVRQAI